MTMFIWSIIAPPLCVHCVYIVCTSNTHSAHISIKTYNNSLDEHKQWFSMWLNQIHAQCLVCTNTQVRQAQMLEQGLRMRLRWRAGNKVRARVCKWNCFCNIQPHSQTINWAFISLIPRPSTELFIGLIPRPTLWVHSVPRHSFLRGRVCWDHSFSIQELENLVSSSSETRFQPMPSVAQTEQVSATVNFPHWSHSQTINWAFQAFPLSTVCKIYHVLYVDSRGREGHFHRFVS